MLKTREYMVGQEGYEKVEQTLTNIPEDEVLVLVNKTKLVAIAWSGKKNKPDWNYKFRDKKQMDKYISDYFCKVEMANKHKAEQKLKKEKNKAEFFESIKVGDIFVDSWGYDQTNVDFYLVTKKLKASIKIVKIGSKIVSESKGAVRVVPVPDAVIGEEQTKVPQGGYGSDDGYIRTYSFSHAMLWNGHPVHETAAGWGH
jgi:hypothetical protein